MTTPNDSHLVDPSDRIHRPPPPITIDVDTTDLDRVEELLAGLDAVEVEPVPYHEDEAHLIEVTRQSRRMCWDNHGEAPGEHVTIAGHSWLLWLDRAETTELGEDGQPVAAFHIDRIEG